MLSIIRLEFHKEYLYYINEIMSVIKANSIP